MVTILLPIFNDEKYIGYCINSLLSQTYADFECFIGFNGTKDGSKKIVLGLIENDDRFKVFDFGDQKGKSITLNKILLHVKTDFVCLIDADDMWDNNKLELQIEEFKSKNVDIVGSSCYYIDENNSIISNPISVQEFDSEIKKLTLQGRNQIINSSFMAKTFWIKNISGWCEDLPALEDYDMWIRLIKNDVVFTNIQKPLVYHRIHKESNFNSKEWDIKPHHILERNKVFTKI